MLELGDSGESRGSQLNPEWLMTELASLRVQERLPGVQHLGGGFAIGRRENRSVTSGVLAQGDRTGLWEVEQAFGYLD